MAYITLDRSKLRNNYEYLNELFASNGIQWSIVSKLLCGNETFLNELIDLGVDGLCDSRLSNLEKIKQLSEDVQTIYIKPPPKRIAKDVVRVADVSFNTEIETIEALSKAAVEQNKNHKVIIMIEMGELREGVVGDDLIGFYRRIFQLPNIEVIGIGTNLTCMNGVLPSHDKLIQLCLYEQLIEATFDAEIPWVSGGASVTIPLIFNNLLPKGVNHFRVGETLYLGTNVYNSSTFPDMENDIFQLHAEIIEINEKPKVPMGQLGKNLTGDTKEVNEDDFGKSSKRAIIDMGLLDIDEKHIHLKDDSLTVVGASSDMLVVDLSDNPRNLQIGDHLEFELDYMGILRVMNSKYIDKEVI